jgi:hypothetical protein
MWQLRAEAVDECSGGEPGAERNGMEYITGSSGRHGHVRGAALRAADHAGNN